MILGTEEKIMIRFMTLQFYSKRAIIIEIPKGI